MKTLREYIEVIDEANSLDTVDSAYKRYSLSEISPKQMYEWVKTGHVGLKQFLRWVEILPSSQTPIEEDAADDVAKIAKEMRK